MDFDLENLNEIINLAGNAGRTTGGIAKTADAIKGLFKKSEAAADADIKLALSDLTVQIANAQLANSELKFQLASLQDELAKAQAFQSDIERYELWETPTGSVVYRLCKSADANEPLHYLCPSCVEEKRKSILQGNKFARNCHTCKVHFLFEKQAISIPKKTRGGW